MPKIKSLAVGLTHKGFPGKRFNVEMWEGRLPERYNSQATRYMAPEVVNDPVKWALAGLDEAFRDNWMADGEYPFPEDKRYSYTQNETIMVLVEDKEPVFNEFGEISP